MADRRITFPDRQTSTSTFDKPETHPPLTTTLELDETTMEIPMPSPILLNCHYILAKIINQSTLRKTLATTGDGAMDRFDSTELMFSDELAEDGSSSLREVVCIALRDVQIEPMQFVHFARNYLY